MAEIEIFSDRLNTMRTYNEGSPVRTSAITRPYEAINPFRAAFSNFEINGRWSIIIEQNGSNGNYDDSSSGNSVSVGTISDVVIIVTDHAGEEDTTLVTPLRTSSSTTLCNAPYLSTSHLLIVHLLYFT